MTQDTQSTKGAHLFVRRIWVSLIQLLRQSLQNFTQAAPDTKRKTSAIVRLAYLDKANHIFRDTKPIRGCSVLLCRAANHGFAG